MWNLHVLPVLTWVFFSQSKDMQLRLMGNPKLPVGVNVSVNVCLSLCQPCDRPRLLPNVSCDWVELDLNLDLNLFKAL